MNIWVARQNIQVACSFCVDYGTNSAVYWIQSAYQVSCFLDNDEKKKVKELSGRYAQAGKWETRATYKSCRDIHPPAWPKNPKMLMNYAGGLKLDLIYIQ